MLGEVRLAHVHYVAMMTFQILLTRSISYRTDLLVGGQPCVSPIGEAWLKDLRIWAASLSSDDEVSKGKSEPRENYYA